MVKASQNSWFSEEDGVIRDKQTFRAEVTVNQSIWQSNLERFRDAESVDSHRRTDNYLTTQRH